MWASHTSLSGQTEAQQGQPRIMWHRRSASVPAFRSVHAFTHCKYVWGRLCVFAFDLGSVIWMSTTSLKSTSVLSSNVRTPIWVISSLILFSVSMCTAVFLIKNYREKIVLFFSFLAPVRLTRGCLSYDQDLKGWIFHMCFGRIFGLWVKWWQIYLLSVC